MKWNSRNFMNNRLRKKRNSNNSKKYGISNLEFQKSLINMQ